MKKILSLCLACLLFLSVACLPGCHFDITPVDATPLGGPDETTVDYQSSGNKRFATGALESDPEKVSMKMRSNASAAASALPASYDNSAAYPPPGNQGSQGSCVGWSVAYAYKSMQDATDHGWQLNRDTSFSPAFVYNQINDGEDAGSYIEDAMDLVLGQGICLWNDMPYKESDYLSQPSGAAKQNAYPHRSEKWYTVEGLNPIKTAIMSTGGAVISIPCYDEIFDLNPSHYVYKSTAGEMEGWHAICLVGWDDSLHAFKFINSWGTDWGLGGFGYVSYEIAQTRKYAFVMVDLAEEDDDNGDFLVVFSVDDRDDNFDSVSVPAHEEYTIPGIPPNSLGQSLSSWSVYSMEENGFLWYNDATENYQYFPYEEFPGDGWDIACLAEGDRFTGLADPGGVIVLMANWGEGGRLAESYTIRFDANAGIGYLPDMTVAIGDGVTLPRNIFTRAGAEFLGWYIYDPTDGTWGYESPDGDVFLYPSGEAPYGYEAKIYDDETFFNEGVTRTANSVLIFRAAWSQ